MTSAIRGILVGYDGSPGSEQALLWAAREASWRGTIVTVCHAWTTGYFPGPPGDDGASDWAQRAGERSLTQGLRFARNVMGPGGAQPLLSSRPGRPATVRAQRGRRHGRGRGQGAWRAARDAAGVG